MGKKREYITLELPGIPPSLNEFANWHYHKRNKVKKEWEELMERYAPLAPPEPWEKAIVTITYHFRDRRRRDPDNYSGKYLMDPLVRIRFLEDDSFDNVELRHRKGDVDKNPYVEIFLERNA